MREILTVIEHQIISVSNKRDISKNIISYEDKNLLLDIIFINKRSNKKVNVFKSRGRNKIQVSSIVGSVVLKNNLVIEILPKFTQNNLSKSQIEKSRSNLITMISLSSDKNLISSLTLSSKIDASKMPLIDYIIELFSNALIEELRRNLYFEYGKRIKNSSYIRGKVLISKTIQNNFIDKSKAIIEYREQQINNLLMQIFKTLAYLLLKDNSVSYNAKNNLIEVFHILNDADIIDLHIRDFDRVIFNRLNDNFRTLFQQAKFIFLQYIPFTTNINSIPFWSILFDMDYLFEEFLYFLFRKSNINVKKQFSFIAYANKDRTVKGRPDFILKDSDDNTIVADAKWKLLKNEKLYGLNSQNFWQLSSYMNLIQEDEIKGYFIVPKISNSFNDLIEFESKLPDKESIRILSIDFSLDLRDIIREYRFYFKEKKLFFDKDYEMIDSDKNISILEKEFLTLRDNHQKNKKNYIRGITEKDFKEQYPIITDILSEIGKGNFDKDKIILKDFVKLSKSKIKNIFKKMKDENKIDIDLIIDNILKIEDSKLAKNLKRKNQFKSWKKIHK